jgi:seryl-tRNA(Sec) selenium transferase
LAGRFELVRAARLQSAPIQGIGRPLKVSKEEIVGLLTALEIWVSRDHAADLRDAKRRTDRVVQALSDLPGIAVEHRFPDHAGRPYPTVFVSIDPSTGLTGANVIDRMLAGDPSIAIMNFSDPQVVRVDVRVLSDDETGIIAARLRAVLEATPARQISRV